MLRQAQHEEQITASPRAFRRVRPQSPLLRRRVGKFHADDVAVLVARFGVGRRIVIEGPAIVVEVMRISRRDHELVGNEIVVQRQLQRRTVARLGIMGSARRQIHAGFIRRKCMGEPGIDREQIGQPRLGVSETV